MNAKKLLVFLLALMIAVAAAGCGNTQTQKEVEGAEAQNASAREARIADNELIVAIGTEPETGFDSTTGSHGSITKLFFSTLFKRDKQLGWVGDLATGYEVSPDKLTWTVTLRDDARFSDGTNVTAEDVVYTYMTAKEAGTDIDLTIIDKIDVIDDTTVAFRVIRPYSPFMERLAYLGIIPKHAHNETFKDQPIGSGPYTFVEWTKGQQLIAVANDHYYGEAPKIKKLTLVFMAMDTAFEAVKNGTIDAAQINGSLAQQTVAGAQVINIASIECYGVSFPMVPNEGTLAQDGAEMGNNVTCDPAIRKALNAAIDRQKIVDGILMGFGTVSTTGLEKMPWLNEDTVLNPSEYANTDAAKKILTDGGWTDTNNDGIVEKNGQDAIFTLLYTDGVYRQEMCLEFMNVAASIGIKVELEKTTWSTILPKIHTSAVHYGFGSGDPSELYNLYYGPNAGGIVAWDNSGFYNNPGVNDAIDKALNSTDEAEAITYWRELQTYSSARGDAPFCWMANANHVYLAADSFDFGQPVVQPHGGRIFDNVAEWYWKK